MFGNKENMAEVARVSSLIGADMRITGTVISDGPVVCAGQIEGTIECDSLHILPGGTLNGDINAKSVTVDGVMVGTIKAETVQLAKHADFNGELCCDGIAIDEGAKIEASFSKGQVKNG